MKKRIDTEIIEKKESCDEGYIYISSLHGRTSPDEPTSWKKCVHEELSRTTVKDRM